MTLTEERPPVKTDTEERTRDELHLPDLLIQGFRGIENLHIKNLGRVTMLTGRNSIGKTSVLDAVRVYAARGSYRSLTNLLSGREEFAEMKAEEGNNATGIDLSGLFHGWKVDDNSTIIVGASNNQNQLKIEIGDASRVELERFDSLNPDVYEIGDKVLRVRFDTSRYDLPWVFSLNDVAAPMSLRFDRRVPAMQRQQRTLPEIPCATFGPGLPENRDLAETWGKVLFTDYEKKALKALKIVLGDDIVRVAAVSGPRGRLRGEPRLIAERAGAGRQFPLKAFGDGALRMLGVALALAKGRDGFLLIDEAENGIHYSVQADFWRMVLRSAHENNVQVIATTHSYDCVLGFAQAAFETPEVDGRLVQLSDRRGSLRAYELPEEELINAAQQRIEVRG